MINFFVLILLVISFESNAANFILKWNFTNNLKFEARTMKATSSVRARVGEKGIYNPSVNLPTERELIDGNISIEKNKEAYIYALFKNNENRTITFSVSPHSTTPGAQALGFKFSCLCNGHVYTVKPGEIWYKIMSIGTNQFKDQTDVVLAHDVFEVKKINTNDKAIEHKHIH